MLLGIVLTQDEFQVKVFEAVYVLNKLVRNHLLVAQGAVLVHLHALAAVSLVLAFTRGSFVLSINVFGRSNGVLVKGRVLLFRGGV
jgi:hypothetical protein